MSELKILRDDSWLKPYAADIEYRLRSYREVKDSITNGTGDISSFADGYMYFGFHKDEKGRFIYREWAPGADEMHLTGDFNKWDRLSHPMTKKGDIFEIVIPRYRAPKNGSRLKALVTKDGVTTEHIPAWANYVVQDEKDYSWCAEVHFSKPYTWHDQDRKLDMPPLIYECHVGMAQDKYGVGTYDEFRENILPRIVKDGYNTIQIMAVMEHPYYGSFGYQVSNFFAASSRYGTPEQLKRLVDAAHKKGLRVLLDVVHSHAVKNTVEGLNQFDGTDYQYFHEGPKGEHPAWGTKLFNYGKHEVLHFLLSNLKFWMEEYHFDGFRFDGVTSMLYHDHGLGTAFSDYSKYFSMNTHTEAVTYLMLANDLIHTVNPHAMTIAEDMSGMPGMCLPIEDGGIGFDYRLSMGTPDMWIKLLKEKKDEDWSMWGLWHELTQKREGEKRIGYAESHDQALVGDKTIMFRLADAEMYTGMSRLMPPNMVVDRALALHKMIRLITMLLGGEGYLNFMGNEFGHPEWIDFPREGNGWSYHYCRRQWSLLDDHDLKYAGLNAFDNAMLKEAKIKGFDTAEPHNLWVHEQDKVLIFEKNGAICAFNFNPEKSFTGYFVPVFDAGYYREVLNTDDKKFEGFGRVDDDVIYHTEKISDSRIGFMAYLPSRTAVIYRRTAKR